MKYFYLGDRYKILLLWVGLEIGVFFEDSLFIGLLLMCLFIKGILCLRVIEYLIMVFRRDREKEVKIY